MRILKTLFFVPLAFLFLNTAILSAGLQEVVADLKEDLQISTQEIGKLRLEVEELNRSLEKMKNTLSHLKSESANLDKRETTRHESLVDVMKTIETNLNAQRQTIAKEINERLEVFSKRTHDAIKSMAKSVEEKPHEEPVFSNNYPKEGIAYTVKKGDTLSVIALKNNSSTRYIMDANRIADAKHIRPGQLIFIPQKSKAN